MQHILTVLYIQCPKSGGGGETPIILYPPAPTPTKYIFTMIASLHVGFNGYLYLHHGHFSHFGYVHYGNGLHGKRPLWVTAILGTTLMGSCHFGDGHVGNNYPYGKRPLWETAILGTDILGMVQTTL